MIHEEFRDSAPPDEFRPEDFHGFDEALADHLREYDEDEQERAA